MNDLELVEIKAVLEVMHCKTIYDALGDWRPDVVVGPTRGGLIPAAFLSHALDIQMLALNWSTRDHVFQTYPRSSAVALANKRILLVDDINDTGETFKVLTRELLTGHDGVAAPSEIRTAAMYQRATSSWKCDYVGVEISTDEWITFLCETAGEQISTSD